MKGVVGIIKGLIKKVKRKRKAKAEGLSRRCILSIESTCSIVTLRIIAIKAIEVALASKAMKKDIIVIKK